MKKKALIGILILALVIILAIAVFVIIKQKKKTEEDNIETIENLKEETGATANTDIYQVGQEYDGREILEIKPDVQLQTVWAGIDKEEQPTEEDTSTSWNNKPSKTGIWISENSREKFLEILKDNGINNFKINEEGYLTKETSNPNELAKKIEKMIDSNKIYIIDISGVCYIRDEMTGELVEYPFEKMDPYQVCEPFYSDNNVIIEITTNSAGKLTNQEILSAIVEY